MVKLKRNSGVIFLGLMILTVACFKSEPLPSFEEQLEKDLAILDKYLEDNNITTQPDPNNLIRYVIHEEGEPTAPFTVDNCVTTSYKGMYLNGNVFDQRSELSFPLRNVIVGWQIGIPLLQKGDSATLYIPSGLGYGSSTWNGIPANSNLIFNVRLKKIGSTYNADNGSCN